METVSTLLALYEGTPLVTGGFPSKRPVMLCFGVSAPEQTVKQTTGDLRRHHAHYDATVMIEN